MTSKILTYEKAKLLGLKYYFTGMLCKNGHLDNRYISDKACVICAREKRKKQRIKHIENEKKYKKEYEAKNQNKVKKWRKQTYLNNKEKVLKANNEYYKQNKEIILKRQSDYYWAHREKRLNYVQNNKEWLYPTKKAWKRNNKGIVNALNNLRKTKLLQATPLWVEIEQIKKLYKKCDEISKQTGVKHHVDHIIPLNSKIVCGLHCMDNLQIITAIDNIRKRNHLMTDTTIIRHPTQ